MLSLEPVVKHKFLHRYMQSQVEIRQWGVGTRWKSRSCSSEPDLHPPGKSKFRCPLDERSRVLRQSQTDQQIERKRPDNAKLTSQVRTTSTSRTRWS